MILRYVPYDAIPDYLALGWIVKLPQRTVPYHDRWGVTMEWLCKCQLVEPSIHQLMAYPNP